MLPTRFVVWLQTCFTTLKLCSFSDQVYSTLAAEAIMQGLPLYKLRPKWETHLPEQPLQS